MHSMVMVTSKGIVKSAVVDQTFESAEFGEAVTRCRGPVSRVGRREPGVNQTGASSKHVHVEVVLVEKT